MMKWHSLLIMGLLMASCGHAQEIKEMAYRLAGGPCEGCEAIFEYGDRNLSSIDTLLDFGKEGQKIKVSGVIYQTDGKTPAKDIVMYIYHTDQNGLYAHEQGATGWVRQHGDIRGWIKTNRKGEYAFYTLKPGIYPSRSNPAHIHPIILEPDGRYYWLGSYHFAGDSLLTQKEMHPMSPRGGSSGLLHLRKEGILWTGRRDFILGKNIPDYD